MEQKDLLFHYTSIIGLNGIISSKCVWASDCRYLNDNKELEHAINLFLNKFDEPKKRILETALNWHKFSRLCGVFSLSRSPTVLSQWRAYGDDGRGASIGFKRQYIEGIGNKHNSILVECVYDKHDEFLDDMITCCGKEINELVNINSRTGGSLSNKFMQQLDENSTLLDQIIAEIMRIKNPAFREEQEVRSVSFANITPTSNLIKTRVTNGLIVPFVEHMIEDTNDLWCVFPEIWLGPKCDRRNEQALKVFCQMGWNINQYDCGYI